MKVSVVIPAYCVERTICEAVDSALGQDFKDLEVIVVDDCSTDRTAVVLRERYGRDGRVRIVTLEQNGGPAAARNRGVELAQGEWIAFLDADDMWLPWRLSTQLDMAAKHQGIDCWCGQAIRWGEPGMMDAMPKRTANPSFHELALDDLLTSNTVATSSVLVRKKCLLDVGGFDPAFRGPEDFDLWLRIAATRPVAFIETFLMRYRYTPGSLSLDDRRFLPEVLRVLDKAFGVGGVLEGRRSERPLAESTQYWNASWMAFVRRDRGVALRLWYRAWRMNRAGPKSVARPWWRLLVRYAVGRKPTGVATRVRP